MAVPDSEVVWEVWAARLGTAERRARDNFLMPGERTGMMRLDFTMWIARHEDQVVVVDTGFAPEAGARRGRVLDTKPSDALRQLGIDPENVETVILSHLHYDHIGNVGDFPRAKIVLQAKEMAYVTGPRMRHPALNHFFEIDDIADMVRRIHAGQVSMLEGDATIADGLEVYLIGGHTEGLQVTRVRTQRGWVVLASDAVHYYANFHERNPFPSVVDVGQMLEGYDRLLELADTIDHIVPGHDPEVFERYRGAEADGIVALHDMPKESV